MELDHTTIEKICEINVPTVVEVDGKTYTTRTLRLVEEPVKRRGIPECKNVYSLDALIALIQLEAMEIYPDSKIFVACSDYNEVSVYTNVFSGDVDAPWERQDLYTAISKDAPGWTDAWLNYEKAVIALQSRFVPNDGTTYLLDLLSRMSNQSAVDTQDNGITQQTTVKRGIALVGKEAVQPIVALRPYRTFQEVEQPACSMLVRIREGKEENEIGLLEADGGMWKLTARKTIKAYLDEALAPMGDRVIVTL